MSYSLLSKINATRTISNELGIKSKKMRIGKTTPQVYSISREDLYKKFLSKNWIHETDEINIEGINTNTPEKPASDSKALKKNYIQIIITQSAPQKLKCKVVADSAPKEHLQELREKQLNPIKDTNSFSDCYLSDEEPDQEDNLPAKKSVPKEDDDYDILDDMLSDSDYTTIDPVPEQHSIPKQQPESPAK
ncbi:hypothetical protein RhiirB3_444706 [Rhizophagus irregularis]|nr:hypothetical protein RhiirB3_444706 [Rhizophagus irregularis]